MKKGQVYAGIVEKVIFPNKGIVSLEDGKAAVVKNVVPGQKISFSISKVRKGKVEGRLLELLEKSPIELETAPCEHFGSCGGCVFLNLSYENQLELKERQVKELLEPVYAPYQEKCNNISFEEKFEGVKKSPRQFEYRNKMEFSFGDSYKDGPLSLGMHKRGSFHDIVTVNGCKIVDQDYSEILSAVLSFFQTYNSFEKFKEFQGTENFMDGEHKAGVPYYHKMRHIGYLRHLLVRKAARTGEILIDLVTTTQIYGEAEEKLLEGFRDELLKLKLAGNITGILHTHNDSLADAVINQGTRILYGKDYFYEELLGLRFRISPFSFFQTNSLGAEVLYETVREYIADAGNGKVVYDLYSGTGTIAQILAPVAKKVIGVEIVEEAVETARKNAVLNQLHNCEFIVGDVLKVLGSIEEKPDVIVLDPPREGIHPKALEQIIRYGVEKMVYISCKPSSLARDLEVLQARGYMVERICCVDMFPATANIESIVLLSHKLPNSVINVTVEFGDGEGKVPLDAIAERAKKYQPKPKITYKMIQEYVEKKYGLKVHTAYIAEVKRSLGLTMYDAPNAVEELKQPRKHPPKEKVEAIKDALKYFEVI